MDILTIALSVLRRWYITVPVMVATVAIAFYVNSTIPPQYEASGQILLASPDLDPSNLPRSSIDLGSLAGQLNTEAVRSPLQVGDSDIEASAAADSLSLVVTADSPADAQATTDNVIDWLAQQVDQRQEDQGFIAAERIRLQASTQEIDSEETQELDADPSAAGAAPEGAVLVTAITLDDPAARVSNPYGASNQTGRILTVAVQSDEGRRAVAQRAGSSVDFTIGQNARDAAPILTITTYGADPGAVLEAFDHVADEVETTLSDREERAEVPPTRRTRIEPIAVPQSVTDVSPPLDRSVAAIIGLGGLLALALVVMVDSLQARRPKQGEPHTSAGWWSGSATPTTPEVDAEFASGPDWDETDDGGGPAGRSRARGTGVY